MITHVSAAMKHLLLSPRALVVLPLSVLFVSGALNADEPADGDVGKQLFLRGATPPCAICHTLQRAGAQGAVGPSLDELKPDAERVMKAVRNGVGQMPAFTSLTDQQIEAIARYVDRATGASQ